MSAGDFPDNQNSFFQSPFNEYYPWNQNNSAMYLFEYKKAIEKLMPPPIVKSKKKKKSKEIIETETDPNIILAELLETIDRIFGVKGEIEKALKNRQEELDDLTRKIARKISNTLSPWTLQKDKGMPGIEIAAGGLVWVLKNHGNYTVNNSRDKTILQNFRERLPAFITSYLSRDQGKLELFNEQKDALLSLEKILDRCL